MCRPALSNYSPLAAETAVVKAKVTKKPNVIANIKKEKEETKKEDNITTVKPKMKQSKNPLGDQQKNKTSSDIRNTVKTNEVTKKPVKTIIGDKKPPIIKDGKKPKTTNETKKGVKLSKKYGKIIDVENENLGTEDEEEEEEQWTKLEDTLAKLDVQQSQPASQQSIQQQAPPARAVGGEAPPARVVGGTVEEVGELGAIQTIRVRRVRKAP